MSSEDLTLRVRASLAKAKAENDGGASGEGALSRIASAFGAKKSAPEPGASPRDLIAEGRIAAVSVSPAGVAKVTLNAEGLSPDDAAALGRLAEAAAARVEGVARAVVVGGPQAAPRTAPPRSIARSMGGHDNPLGVPAGAQSAKQERIAAGAHALKDVGRVIAVASGKGGVGKSTVALYLALALSARGLKTGLLDADIYGPSLPTLTGWRAGDKPEMNDGRIQPVNAFGLKTMSIGYLVDDAKALAWRGPMVMGATRQMLSDVEWGALDVLIIDTPPGTGDVHLTMAREKRGDRALLDAAIVVTTPQPLARADVARGLQFFEAVGVRVLGVTQNMAFMETPDGARVYPFGAPEETSPDDAAPPLLAELPVDPALARLGVAPPDVDALPASVKAAFEALADAAMR
ncbi:MAG: P-loop NTPase [Pseudomonadota bacterium]